ncbi:hypothetical protein [Haloferax volcanii]|uniref:hypothetical protein n=1 Tax=Haloferax volcanii TaxID=2246 RepID=UPI0023DCA246|nr:hypothetical protein [Haloferax lucentense]
MTETWKYALIGGLLALPFTALAAWRSPENISLGIVVVGSVEILRELHVRPVIPRDEAPPEVADSPVY